LASLKKRYFSGRDFAWCLYSSLEKSDISMEVVEASSEKFFSSSLERKAHPGYVTYMKQPPN